MTSPWTQTLTGQKWDLLAPTPKMVDWSEIAHVLARVPRFAGHTHSALSVARHSLHVEHFVKEAGGNVRARLFAILHDAHEFVLGDMSTPVQQALTLLMRSYNERLGQPLAVDFKTVLADLKARTDRAIFTAAGLNAADVHNYRAMVHDADLTALMSERHMFMEDPPEPWDAALEARAIHPLPSHTPGVAVSVAFLAKITSLRNQVRAQNKAEGIIPGDGWEF